MNSPSALDSSAKRKHADDDHHLNGGSKKQRTRVSFSCGECHRRKQKCDRQMPCSHCIARKVPELCQPYTPGAEKDISVRLLRLERIIEAALPQFCGSNVPLGNAHERIPGSARRSISLAEDEYNSFSEDQDPNGGSFQSGKWYGNSALGSVAPGSVIEQLQHALPGENHSDSHPGRPKSSHDIGGEEGSSNKALEGEVSATDNLKFLVQEYGVSPHKMLELLQELPPQRLSDALVDHYFAAINWTRYPLLEKDFRNSYSSICANNKNGVGTANPGDVRFLPLLFVVLAIAVRLSPETIGGDSRTRRVTSLRYYWSSRRALLVGAAIQPDSVDIVLTRLLSARFLTFDRRITECWSQLGAAVRTAQALGLHRDGSTMGMDAAHTENRRRVWSYLYHADRSYALVLGRPQAIQDDYTSTLPPSNIDDETLASNPRPMQKPLSIPTPMTFVILRHALAGIIGRMVHHFQKVRGSSPYSEVTAVDEELMRFIQTLPPHFALDPDKSLDDTSKYIPVHRFLLITEIMFVRISLHRPYILRKLGSDRYSRSRTACFESALTDFKVRQAFRELQPKEARDALSNAYREFQTAMISGIYLVLDPHGSKAEEMHAILDGFMKDNEGVREMDETTRRELKTIEFLKKKASEVESSSDTASKVSSTRRYNGTSSPSPTLTENPAQLLLGLQYSNSGTPSNLRSNGLHIPNQIHPAPTGQPSSLPYQQPNQMSLSPTFQRLQAVANDGLVSSPMGSGSPGAEDESSAQSLLDNWINSVSNGSMTDGTIANMPWGSSGDTDISGWVGPASSAQLLNPQSLNAFDGTDWGYWEHLVQTIHRGP